MKPTYTKVHVTDLQFKASDGETYPLPYGQEIKVYSHVCRKTGLTDCDPNDPQYRDFGDSGFWEDIEVIGGPSDGARGKLLNCGYTGDCE